MRKKKTKYPYTREEQCNVIKQLEKLEGVDLIRSNYAPVVRDLMIFDDEECSLNHEKEINAKRINKLINNIYGNEFSLDLATDYVSVNAAKDAKLSFKWMIYHRHENDDCALVSNVSFDVIFNGKHYDSIKNLKVLTERS